MAAAVIAGEKITALAARERVSRSHLSREANSPQTQLIMSELLAEHEAKVRELVARSLTAIEDALVGASRQGVTGEGLVYDAGPDHFARLAAAKRLLEMIQAARPAEQERARATITWETFLELFHAQ